MLSSLLSRARRALRSTIWRTVDIVSHFRSLHPSCVPSTTVSAEAIISSRSGFGRVVRESYHEVAAIWSSYEMPEERWVEDRDAVNGYF